MSRWKSSQIEIEKSLARGPRTVKALIEETGYSHNTVRSALARCAVLDAGTWPPTYSFVKSAMSKEDAAAEAEVVTEYIPIVEPVEFATEKVGAVWRDDRSNMARGIKAADPDEMDLATFQLKIKNLAAMALGLHIALAKVKDGPDWRDQIGLTELP